MLTKANWDAELVGGGVGLEPERRRRVPARLLPPPVNWETRKQPTRGLGSRLSSSLRHRRAWILSPSFQTRQTGAFLDPTGCQAEFYGGRNSSLQQKKKKPSVPAASP